MIPRPDIERPCESCGAEAKEGERLCEGCAAWEEIKMTIRQNLSVIEHPRPPGKPMTYCRYCLSSDLKQLPGNVHYRAGIGCASCGRHLGWLPKPEGVA